MIRLQKLSRVSGLLLGALIAVGCGAPAQPTPATPTAADAGDPVPGYPVPGYPPPAATVTPGYPPPATPAPVPYPYPYPGPGQGDAAPGAGEAAAGQAQVDFTPDGAPVAGVTVVATYPHDRRAYTQGLVYIGGDTLYESTGNYAASSLREVSLATGEVRRQVLLQDVLPPRDSGEPHFGEGIAVAGDRIFQITWLYGAGVIYDRDFRKVGEFSYGPPAGQQRPVEGWGLTYDEASGRLIMSDGTATLYFVDPVETERTGVLAITGQVEVRDGQRPLTRLNELELVGGEIFANIYLDSPDRNPDWIARIDPASGQVLGYLDLSPLRGLLDSDPGLPRHEPPEALNGIAYDAERDRLLVTGKNWPNLFEIDLPVARAFLPVAENLLSPATFAHARS